MAFSELERFNVASIFFSIFGWNFEEQIQNQEIDTCLCRADIAQDRRKTVAITLPSSITLHAVFAFPELYNQFDCVQTYLLLP